MLSLFLSFCLIVETGIFVLDQAALGERTSGEGKGERVVLKLTVDGSEFVIATLSAGKCEQTTLDLILDREFLISHNGSSSVYLTGYKTDAVRDEYPFFLSFFALLILSSCFRRRY